MDQDLTTAPPDALQFVIAYPYAQVVHVAVHLGVADLLGGGAQSVVDLAAATGTHAPSLARLLRALAALGLVVQEADGRVALTPRGDALRRDAPGSIRDRVLFLTGEWLWRSWGALLYSAQTGQPAFDREFGMSNFAYWAHNRVAGAIHDAAFVQMARTSTTPLLAAYDFSACATIVDVGGSTGPLLAAILATYPRARGILFDLPHVVAGAGPILEAAGVADRCTTVGGSFFEAVPPGGDAYILKYILHDWDDDRASGILQHCRVAMVPGATLLIEHVLPEHLEAGPAAEWAARLDLQMLVLTPGGRDRTEGEFHALLGDAGFALQRLVPTAAGLQILEAVAV